MTNQKWITKDNGDKNDGNARMEKVIDSDIAYIAKGKFEED